MPDPPREDRDTLTALVLVVVLLVIIATGLIVLQYEGAGQYRPGGREAHNLALSSGDLEWLEQRGLLPDRSGALLRPSPPNRQPTRPRAGEAPRIVAAWPRRPVTAQPAGPEQGSATLVTTALTAWDN
jgi:hypothetical protein